MTKTKRPLLIVVIMVIFLGVTAALIATEWHGNAADFRAQASPSPTSSGQPGAVNPILNPARCSFFPYDEIFTLYGKSDDGKMYASWNRANDDVLTGWHNMENNTAATGYNHIASTGSPVRAGSGRIETILKDAVACTYYTTSGASVNTNVVLYGSTTKQKVIHTETKTGSYPSIDIAVGDPDRTIDDVAKNYLDEIVVAYRITRTDGTPGIRITILDKDLDVISSCDCPDQLNVANPKFSVAMGDLEPDGIAEIALVQVDVNSHVVLNTFKMDENLQLKPKDRLMVYADAGYTYRPDVVVADLNGDGPDEIVVSAPFALGSSSMFGYFNISFFVCTAPQGQALALKKRSDVPHFYPSAAGEMHELGYWSNGTPIGDFEMTSGLFRLDLTPGSKYTTARRQLAMVSGFSSSASNNGADPGTAYTIRVTTYNTSDDLYLGPIGYAEIQDAKYTRGYPGTKLPAGYTVSTAIEPQISSGNFLGPLSPSAQSPHDDIVVSFGAVSGGSVYPKFAVVHVEDTDYLSLEFMESNPLYDFKAGTATAINPSLISGIPVVATDRTGEGFFLGAPAHIETNTLISTDYTIQEPPQHVDYVLDIAGTIGVLSITRNDEFFTQMVNESKETFSASHAGTFSRTWGWSMEASVEDTIKRGGKIRGQNFNMGIAAKCEADYDTVTTTTTGFQSSMTTCSKESTRYDDIVQGKYRTQDIWRYPVYGWKSDDGNQMYYEVTLAGPEGDTFNGPGLDFDWYQPLHENGNILSYPTTGASSFPPDLGSTTTDNGLTLSMLNTPSDQLLGGVVGSFYLTLDKVNSAGIKCENSTKIGGSGDIKGGVQIRSKIPDTRIKNQLDIKGQADFHGNHVEADCFNAKAQHSVQQKILISFPEVGTNYTYGFRPFIYFADDGSLKVAYEADPLATSLGRKWWGDTYGTKPDPALNLPSRFYKNPNTYLTENEWDFSPTRQLRSRMRGLFLMKQWEEDDGDRDYLAIVPNPSGNQDPENINPGDYTNNTICVMARVYNYCLSNNTGAFDVDFHYAEATNWGDAEPELHYIGTYRVDAHGIPPRGMVEAHVDWNVSGLNGNYVIYVTLDPRNEVKNEIHEFRDMNGNVWIDSNNQGYWPPSNGILICPDEEETVSGTGSSRRQVTQNNISVKPESIQVNHEHDPSATGKVKALRVGQKYTVKGTFTSDQVDRTIRHIHIFENDQMIASRMLHGIRKGENTCSFSFTPREAGVRTFKVKVRGDSLDPNLKDNEATFTLEVLDQNGNSVNTAGGSGGGGCFIATAAFGSYQEPHVQVLRQFRDRFLMTNGIGTSFVHFYYKNSPPLAAWITRHPSARALTRTALLPAYGFSYLAVSGWLWPIVAIMGIIAVSIAVARRRKREKVQVQA